MKVGDRVFVRGYINEIRKYTVVVRNDGGYFGTIPSEVITGELPSAQPEIIRCKDCKYHRYEHDKTGDIPYCSNADYGYGWKDNDFCSRAERRTDGSD